MTPAEELELNRLCAHLDNAADTGTTVTHDVRERITELETKAIRDNWNRHS